MSENIVSTPTRERCVTSYAARTQYRPGEVRPPHIKVKDAIDIHCHAHEGQQNPFDLAKRASKARKGWSLSTPVSSTAMTVPVPSKDKPAEPPGHTWSAWTNGTLSARNGR